MNREGAIPLSGVSECGLPRELWELIFAQVDEWTLSVAVPLVSVFCHKQSFDNAVLWRRKCAERYGPGAVKPDRLTWKQYYFAGCDLLPYRGIMLGQTTHAQLLAMPGAVASATDTSSTQYVTIDRLTYWLNAEHVCDSLSTSQYLPRRWQWKGLTLQGSFNSYKALFKQLHGNYHVTSRPQRKQLKKQRVQWNAALTSVGKARHGYYQLALSFFSLNGGDEDRAGLLSSFTLSVRNAAELEQIYTAQQLRD